MYLEFRKHFNACVKGYDSGYQKKNVLLDRNLKQYLGGHLQLDMIKN